MAKYGSKNNKGAGPGVEAHYKGKAGPKGLAAGGKVKNTTSGPKGGQFTRQQGANTTGRVTGTATRSAHKPGKSAPQRHNGKPQTKGDQMVSEDFCSHNTGHGLPDDPYGHAGTGYGDGGDGGVTM